MMNNKDEMEQILILQERYIDCLNTMRKLLVNKKEKGICLDILEQVECLLQYSCGIKEKYYGRGLDWVEEYAFFIIKNMKENIELNEYDNAYDLVPILINYIRKSNEILTEILETGLYNVNLGVMHLKSNINLLQIKNRNELINSIDVKSMNDLEKFFFFGKHNKMTKWFHYFEVYNNFFEKFRGKEVTILEIGVWGGGSLQMWKDYFGDNCKIIGVDIMEECKNYEEDRIKIYIGSQEDREFLKKIKCENKHIDIIIDDGGHTMNQQITTFEELYPHLSEGGIYLCEDLQTSYWPKYGGGYSKPNSFIEYSKNFIDKLNARYSTSPDLQIDELTKNIYSVHYYDAMIVLEKRKHLSAMVL